MITTTTNTEIMEAIKAELKTIKSKLFRFRGSDWVSVATKVSLEPSHLKVKIMLDGQRGYDNHYIMADSRGWVEKVLEQHIEGNLESIKDTVVKGIEIILDDVYTKNEIENVVIFEEHVNNPFEH